MTVTLTKTHTTWGVRHAAAHDSITHVDQRANETDARRWLNALLFCGNCDAVLVCRGRDTDEWTPAGPAVAP
ncbi:hypothetical protein ACGFNU_21700 [Spirillospora sp. NPDC048911]|uniref:hypothetical protein n=1 Tax=Spirillospora sp. NPDC048911 TaxID=3364527 RepID=UPI0037155FB3